MDEFDATSSHPVLAVTAAKAMSAAINDYARQASGIELAEAAWMWDCCTRFLTPGSAEPEFRGVIGAGPRAWEQLDAWARAFQLDDATTARDLGDGRRSYIGVVGASRIHLSAIRDHG